MTTEALAEALRAADDALPKMGERETVYCSLRGDHLREILAAYRAVPESLGVPASPSGSSLKPFGHAAIPNAADGAPTLPEPFGYAWHEGQITPAGYVANVGFSLGPPPADYGAGQLYTAGQMLNIHEHGRQQGRAQAAARCAEICESLKDVREEVKAALRIAKEMSDGDEEALLRALRHESDVRLYNCGLDKAEKAIRAELGATKGDA